jgi:hypothetical protein
MSRLKQRTIPTLQDLMKERTSREVLIQVDIPSQTSGLEPRMSVAEMSVAEPKAGFCRSCGEWLTPEQIQLGIKFRCPKCDYSLFTINRIGAREKWEKGRESAT